MTQMWLCQATYLDNSKLTCLPGLTSDRQLCCGFAWWSVLNTAYHHRISPFPITGPTWPWLALALWDCALYPWDHHPYQSCCHLQFLACLEQPTIAAHWHRINTVCISVLKRKTIKVKSPLFQRYWSTTGCHSQQHVPPNMMKWWWHREARSLLSDPHNNSDIPICFTAVVLKQSKNA